VIDDDSPDKTCDVVRQYEKKKVNVHLISGKKEGLGIAILRGMKYAVSELKADLIVQMDADLSHDPEVVPKLIAAIDNGADFAVGSRYIPGGSIPENWGLHRKIYSIAANSFVRIGLGFMQIHDWTGGYRAYKSEFAQKLYDEMAQYNGYVFQIAFLHKAVMLHAKVTEVPIHFSDRKYGKSKIVPSEYIMNVFKYVFLARGKTVVKGSFGKFLVVGGIGFFLNAVFLVLFHDLFHWEATISNLIGAAIAIFSNYNLNNLWTFKTNRISGIGQYFYKLAQFYLTSAFGVLVIQTGIIALGVNLFGDEKYFLFFLIGTSLLLIWNYFMYSKVIWKKR
jgi:dolichol-phosphate mannosyltransferase